MGANKEKILVVATIVGLLILLVILWLSLGLSRTFFIVGAIDFAALIAIVIWVLVQYFKLDQRRLSIERRSVLQGEELRIEYSFLRRVAGVPTKFTYQVLEAATDNFQALLGRGSSASVFKGILDDGTPVAVKRIEGSSEQADREFCSEVSVIASVQHVSLVRLLGYCLVAGGPRYLVYDFVRNGSLNKWIFPGDDKSYCLPWPLRYRVAIEVAKGLAYLHHDCRSRVLHLDVKPENILLDENFHALLADFGLSKLMSKDQSRVVITIRGTRGYLAPEWLLDSGVSEKSDIYSYGMVLLEILGGRRNVTLDRKEGGEGGGGTTASAADRKWSYFPKIVADKLRQGRIMEAVDERVLMVEDQAGGRVQEKQVRTLVHVALWCIQEEAKLRPSMARVVDMLEGRMVVGVPPETDMLVLDLLSTDARPSGYVPRAARAAAALSAFQRGNHLEDQGMSASTTATPFMSGR